MAITDMLHMAVNLLAVKVDKMPIFKYFEPIHMVLIKKILQLYYIFVVRIRLGIKNFTKTTKESPFIYHAGPMISKFRRTTVLAEETRLCACKQFCSPTTAF